MQAAAQVSRYTNSHHRLPIADSLLEQRFAPTAPNPAWETGITFTCVIVGHAMDARMTKALTIKTLRKAMLHKRPTRGLTHHSDRCSQYCARAYRRLLDQFGMHASMSRKGNCFDNAPMENFWGGVKNGLIHHQRGCDAH